LLAGPWHVRIGWAAALTTCALLPLVAWSIVNGQRFGDYALARGGNAIIPFYRAFITDHIVSPENGDDSRKLARAMQQHLLTREPYRSYDVTLDELFREGSFRVHEDLYNLSDEVFGWDSAYSVLRGAGVEGVRAHPGTYASGVGRTIWNELAGKAFFRDVSSTASPGGKPSAERVVIRGQRLPRPSEGQPIPGGQVAWISRPDQSIRQVWTSPTTYHFEFRKPRQRRRFDEIQKRLRELTGGLSDRQGNAQLSLRLNQLSRWYPRPIHWLAIGVLALVVHRPRERLLLLALPLGAMLVVFVNALGLFTDLHFLLPVAPAFVLFGVGGVLSPRG
jgi:hypothetical protein